MACNTFDVENTPVQISKDNTEVKMPMNVADGQRNKLNSASALSTENSTSFSQLSPASQYVCGNSDDLYLQAFNRLISLYRDLPKDMFITSVLQEYGSNEQELDATRTHFFEFLKTHDDFPFPLESELKKRVFTRGRKETVAVKLATDVYTLLSVMEGEEYAVIKEMISVSRRRTFSQLSSVNSGSQPADPNGSARCKCTNELTLLKDTVSSIQAELLMLKQSIHTTNHLRSEEIKAISATLKCLKTDITRHTDVMKDLTKGMASSTCQEVRVLVESLSFTLDKRVSSIEKFLDGENIHVVGIVPNENCDITLPQSHSEHTSEDNLCKGNCNDATKHVYNTTDQNCDTTRSESVGDHVGHTRKTKEVASESPFMFGDVRIPMTSPSASCNPASDLDVYELEKFLLDNSTCSHCDNIDVPITVREPVVSAGQAAITIRDTCSSSSRVRDSFGDKGSTIPVRISIRTQETQTDEYIDFPVMNEYMRKRSKRYYVGGYDDTITPDYISRFVTRKGPKVTFVRIIPTRRQDNKVTIRLNVEADCNADLVLGRGFWPRGVVCRPWLSRSALRRRRDNAHYSDDNGNDGRDYRQRYHRDDASADIQTFNRYSMLSSDVD